MRQPGTKSMNANNYKAATGKIFYGVLGLSILSVLGGILSAIAAAAAVASIVNGGGGGSTWYLIVVPLLTVLCYVYYFLGLGDLYKEFEGDTAANIKKIRTAAILSIIGTLVSLIPLAGGIINAILQIIAAIMCLLAYGNLRNDNVFPGRDGMKTLYVAAILQIVAFVLCIIPLINIIGLILNIIAFIMIIVGWAKVKNAPVESAPAE